MWVAAAMGVAVAGSDAHAAQFERCNPKRCVDVAGPAAADLGPASLR